MKRMEREEYSRVFFDDSWPSGGERRLFLAEPGDYALPGRRARSHKYSYGRALFIAGSVGYSGAPVLAANACERSGAGLTQLLVPESIYPIAACRCDGTVVKPLPAGEDGGFSRKALPLLAPLLKRADACVIGPGLGTGEGVGALVAYILREAACPLVLDADALTICGGSPELLAACRAPVILTPHEGEFRRIGGDLSAGRLTGAFAFASAHPTAILILKGHGTLICGGGEIVVNPTGTPAMAKGGSGDVLCGILAALLAQGFPPLFSARCAVYLHGLAGELACGEYGEYAVAPSDLIRFLPPALQSVCGEGSK